MHSIQEDIQELKKQLAKGSIQKAYAALLAYMMGSRTHFAKSYGDSAVSGLYQGYMDMTCFCSLSAGAEMSRPESGYRFQL